MSEKLLKTRKFDTNLKKIQSDPCLFLDIDESCFGNFVKIVKMSRGKAMEILNNSKTLTSELGVSLIEDSSQLDISNCANQITNALKIPKSLYCPFCGADFMFEFTLKDHLKKRHGCEIREMARNHQTVTDCFQIHNCPCCSAVFYYFALIPIHLSQHHDSSLLRKWQNQTGNMEELKEQQKTCPSLEILSASPAVSEMMQSLDISGGKSLEPETPRVLKSILKKRRNISGKIIFSPSSASLRRMGGDLERRNGSARRELRFDLPPEEFQYTVETTDPLFFLREDPKEVDVGCFGWEKKKKTSKTSTKEQSKCTTSTPIKSKANNNFDPEPKMKHSFWRQLFPKKLKVPLLDLESTSVTPKIYASKRFQCRLCTRKFEDNADLTEHLQKFHSRFRRFIGPQFQCGECGAKFFRNTTFITHTHAHVNPQKKRN